MNDFWLIWLWVMWESISRNIASKWYKLWVYNRTYSKTKDFLNKWFENISWYENLDDFVSSLSSPKKIMIMVEAWKPVDMVIESLISKLNKQDIIIDLWNSFYKDTQKRFEKLEKLEIKYLWIWVSWWELWALYWPSLMPSWEKESYESILPMLKKISAKDFNSWDCVSFIWENWAWHFVKMVHNGIEYAIMQIIAEWYDILKKVYNLNAFEIWEIFKNYSNWPLKSYLLDISVEILNKQDDLKSWEYLIDNILDVAWAKWTWLWTSTEWLNSNSLINWIIESTQYRMLSTKKDLRKKLSKMYNLDKNNLNLDLDIFQKKLENTLYSAMILAFAQWIYMIKDVWEKEKWNINFWEITRIWQWWCIIRADLLKVLTDIFNNNQDILESDEIKNILKNNLNDYKDVLKTALDMNISTFSLSSLHNYFIWITTEFWQANFIQWLRDNFWAHTYQRIDKEWFYHTNWQ